jgi:hypothetical protein
MNFNFTFKNIKNYFQEVLEHGYIILTCEEYITYKKSRNIDNKILVNRIDVDLSLKKALRIAEIFNDLNIKGTFFIRLHAPEYNPFSFENYRCLKMIKEMGHEIGYHSEIIDQSAIWSEPPEDCLKRDLDVLNRILNISVRGVASHRGMTGHNNLDFWKNNKPKDFGLLYEAYDSEPTFNLWNEAFYISDSCWTHWKCYDKGRLIEEDYRTLSEHLSDEHPLIYSLIHPDTYYDHHIYDNE